MTCDSCKLDTSSGVRFGVQVSTIGVTPRHQKSVTTLFLCPKCAANTGGRKIRSTTRTALGKALRLLRSRVTIES